MFRYPQSDIYQRMKKQDFIIDYLQSSRFFNADYTDSPIDKALNHLTKKEFDLIVQRYAFSKSYKSLINMGYSTGTFGITYKIKKLNFILKSYTIYYKNSDLLEDLSLIGLLLDETSMVIADKLFHRIPKTKIIDKVNMPLSIYRINKILINIEDVCYSTESLNNFWSLISKIHHF